jgi:exodeoxyribonuclease V alpha subunit
MATSEGIPLSSPDGLAMLVAVLERETYANEETGYTIARVATRGNSGGDLLIVVGS